MIKGPLSILAHSDLVRSSEELAKARGVKKQQLGYSSLKKLVTCILSRGNTWIFPVKQLDANDLIQSDFCHQHLSP
jgi:hypothetical protein